MSCNTAKSLERSAKEGVGGRGLPLLRRSLHLWAGLLAQV